MIRNRFAPVFAVVVLLATSIVCAQGRRYNIISIVTDDQARWAAWWGAGSTIDALTSERAQLKRERAKSEQRVSLLRTSRIDPDMLDERARYQLDYVNPHDLVRMIPAK